MSVRIHLGNSMGQVSEAIYGQFIEHLGTCINGGVYDPESSFADENGIRTDVRELSKRLAPPVLRFPGGTVMSIYHWEDAIGPVENRIRRKNLIWGGELDPSFGTAEFVMFCRSIGAEPMICVNMASGPRRKRATGWNTATVPAILITPICAAAMAMRNLLMSNTGASAMSATRSRISVPSTM